MEQNVSSSLGKFVALPIVVTIVGVLSVCSPISSQAAPPTICAELDSAIDRNIVEIAVSEVEGEARDKSAAQQAARLTQNSNRWFTIMTNIQLQAQNKCSPRQKPIDASIYSHQALACYEARYEIFSSDKEKAANALATINQTCGLKDWDAQVKK